MQSLTVWLVYATRIVTEWLFIYSVLEASVSFLVTDFFLFTTRGGLSWRAGLS